jgi:hypothetical protein
MSATSGTGDLTGRLPGTFGTTMQSPLYQNSSRHWSPLASLGDANYLSALYPWCTSCSKDSQTGELLPSVNSGRDPQVVCVPAHERADPVGSNKSEKIKPQSW